ncbi:hypothetical protein ISG33_08535 [Glaciecola sp. MH2013]|uniref:hypothetical protein n=1 Tax=Glaciecola sp. MH2013 TaxID=2785524 RepID=UPI00189CBB0E|nr:hypothetical protein [Glaciecola sp. MH2013]MBF7073439.1 hypothetical protein [Glaciecola sp. MH2013]
MNKILTGKFATTLMALFFIMGLSACSEGPAEEAGEKIDEIVEDAGNAVEDACEDAKEATDAKDKDC